MKKRFIPDIKIGFTTGVYDVIHVGHINTILNCKKNCDFLIVAVTTDEEAERVKGKKPVMSFEERARIIESIKGVGKVVPENNVDKLASWEKYGFDIIFKGEDWKGTDLWNYYEKEFEKLGVEVMYFPNVPHVSSTIVKNNIKKSD